MDLGPRESTDLGSRDSSAGQDAGGAEDVGTATVTDAGPGDLGALDTGLSDVGLSDLGPSDVGLSDLGPSDAGLSDAGFPDVGFPDVGFPDAGFPDAGFPDAGFPDAGFPDTGPPDAGLPAFLNVVAASPVGLCAASTIDIDLDGYTGAAADITCSAPPQTLVSEDFEGGRGIFDSESSSSEVELRSWRDNFPSSCPGSGGFIRFDGDDNEAWSELTTPIDARGYQNLVLSLTAAFRDNTDSGEDLEVHTCCGPGCTPSLLATIENGSSGGSDDCMPYTFPLPSSMDQCPALMVRIVYRDAGGDRAAFDDVTLTGELLFFPVNESGSGIYVSAIMSCQPTDAVVTCTWDDGSNPPLSGNDTASFQ
jgi:hypothetical protein